MLLPSTKKPGGFPSNCLNSKTAHGKTSNACNLIQTPTRFLLLYDPNRQVVMQLFFQNTLEKAVLIVKYVALNTATMATR